MENGTALVASFRSDGGTCFLFCTRCTIENHTSLDAVSFHECGKYCGVFTFLWCLGSRHFLLLMMFQSIIAPLPAFLITFANAAVFGWWQGAILSWTSAMAGALVCFYIARIAGRDIVERLNKTFH